MREGLLVDAYNLLYAARASSHARLFPDIKRLAYFLEHYASANGSVVTLAIDGTRFTDELTDTPVLRLLFSEAGRPADAVMEAWMGRLAPGERLSWILVSNDLELTRMGAGMGLRIRSCAALVEDLACFAGSKPSGMFQKSPAPPKPRTPFNNPFKKLAPIVAGIVLAASAPAAAAEFNGFLKPEAVTSDPVTADVYVSNAPPLAAVPAVVPAAVPAADPASAPEATAPAPNTPGFISKISGNRLVVIEKFVQGGTEGSGRELRSPKGLAVIQDRIYVADGDRILVYRTDTGAWIRTVQVEAQPAPALGPLAVGRRGALFAADTSSSRIFRIDTARDHLVSTVLNTESFKSIRGLTFDPVTLRLFAATEEPGQLVSIDDRRGRAKIVRKQTGHLSGIFIDAGGALYVSDEQKGELYRIANRGLGALTLAAGALRDAGGIGYDPIRHEALVLLKTDGRLVTIAVDDRAAPLEPKNSSAGRS